MKKIYMIHGWEGSSQDNWFPWLKREFEKHHLKVEVFDMPNTNEPRISDWVKHLEDKIGDVDEDTYFIGHSIGCQTIIRFLEKLHKHKKVGGCIFVAGWFNLTKEAFEDEEDKMLMNPWMTTHVDFSRVLDHCNNFLAIFSENDPYVPVGEAKIFEEKLGAKTITTKDRGHFTNEEEPIVLTESLKFIHRK